MKEYDIVAIGAGPAGSTLARLLGNRYRILLVDKRKFDGSGPRKSCGGLVAPDAQKMLAAFGLGIPLSVLVSPQIFSVRSLDLASGDECEYQRHYINTDREALDSWLLSLVPDLAPAEGDDGTKNRLASCSFFRGYRQDGRKLLVKYSTEGQQYSVRTKLLVGADGAGSLIRASLQNPADRSSDSRRVYVSMQNWYRSTADNRAFGAFFDKNLTDFYGWTIPKGEHLIVGAAFRPDRDPRAAFGILQQKLREFGYQLDEGKRERREGALIFRPARNGDLFTGKGQTALIGEAAGFISPSSAEGLSYAFRSALHLAEALEFGFDGWAERYKKGCRELYTDILWKRIKSVGMYSPVLRPLALRSGIGGIKPLCRQDFSILSKPARIPLCAR